MKFTAQQLQTLEEQLSLPTGEKGIEIAKSMHANNFSMTKASFLASKILDNDIILELGHGNCDHLNFVLGLKQDIAYYGLEISVTMHQEAKKKTLELNNNNLFFNLYKGVKTPYNTNYFDKIITINTIYFWKKPKEFLIEIARVLKVGASLTLTFADEDFMKNLPFVKNKFNLYTTCKVTDLIKDINLNVLEVISKQEQVRSKSGDLVTRKYHIMILIKNNLNIRSLK